MNDTKKPRLFRWALWWGLGIMVLCLAILIIDDIGSTGDPSSSGMEGPMIDMLYMLIYKLGIWPIVIYIGIIGPIIEELCFRLWGNGKSWTGYISVVLISLWGASIAWWIALIALGAGIAIMVIYDNERTKRLFALMLFSSLMFALVHIGNYDASGSLPMFLIAILHKFGMGLVASYLVINHNILWSMGLHILNNGILAALMGVGFNAAANKVTTIETDDFRLTMQPALTQNQVPDGYECGWLNDSVFYHIGAPDFSAELIYGYHYINPSQDSAYYTIHSSDDSYYPQMKIKMELLNGSQDYNAAIRAIEKEGLIALDTVGDTIHIRNTYNPLENL